MNECAHCRHLEDDHRAYHRADFAAPPCRVEGCDCPSFLPGDDYEPLDWREGEEELMWAGDGPWASVDEDEAD